MIASDSDSDAPIFFKNTYYHIGAAVGWPIRLDREAGFCARLLERRDTCHTALIILGLVLAWISVTLCAYHIITFIIDIPKRFDGSRTHTHIYMYVFFQLSALPCVPTTGGKRERGRPHRFSSTRPDQSSHHRYLFTLGSSPKGRTTESLEILRIFLWSVWKQERGYTRKKNHHESRDHPNARRFFFNEIYMAMIKIQCTRILLVTENLRIKF